MLDNVLSKISLNRGKKNHRYPRKLSRADKTILHHVADVSYLPRSIVLLHTIVDRWASAQEQIGIAKAAQCFKLSDDADGEDAALMIHLVLNSRGNVKYEVVFLEKMNVLFVRKLTEGECVFGPKFVNRRSS